MQTFTTAFYHLLSNPEYIEPLRHDVETAIAEDGWTKAAMDRMLKVDSFLRESRRNDVQGSPLSQYTRTSVTDSQVLIFSRPDPSRITSVYLFQWRYYSCGYSSRRPNYCYPHGRRNLSKS